MADLINTRDPVIRAKELEALGIDIIVAHVGIDQQMVGKSSIDLLTSLAGNLSVPIAVAGGLDSGTAAAAVRSGADIVIVGGWITRSADVKSSTSLIRASIDASGESVPKGPRAGEDVRDIFAEGLFP